MHNIGSADKAQCETSPAEAAKRYLEARTFDVFHQSEKVRLCDSGRLQSDWEPVSQILADIQLILDISFSVAASAYSVACEKAFGVRCRTVQSSVNACYNPYPYLLTTTTLKVKLKGV